MHRHLHEEEADMGGDDLGQPGDHPGREEYDDAGYCVTLPPPIYQLQRSVFYSYLLVIMM